MPDTQARRAVIHELLGSGPIASQEELRRLLRGRGIDVAQATLSRDLRELGCVKGAVGYQRADAAANGHLGRGPGRARDAGDNATRRYVRAVDIGGTLVVVRTGPGQADVVAAELDAGALAGGEGNGPDADFRGILGTIAGDDTIFVACPSAAAARRVGAAIRGAAGLTPPPNAMPKSNGKAAAR